MKYTREQIDNMSYNEMRNVLWDELPDAIQERLHAGMFKNDGMRENTGTKIYFVNGRRVFHAHRHSDRRTGASMWCIDYYKRCWGITKDVIAYKFDVKTVRFGRTADGTDIPRRVNYKKDVIAIMQHIEWINEILTK